MRKLFALFVFASLLITSSCSDDYDDLAVWDSIHSLEDRVSAMETIMNAHKNDLYIKTVEQIENGYRITFSDGSQATITNGRDGADGQNGTNGQNGQNGHDGQDGETLIDRIEVSDTQVIFYLTDGTQFAIPIGCALGVTFSEIPQIAAGMEIEFRYQLTNASDDALLSVSSDGNYKAQVRRESALAGSIKVLCPSPLVDGYINVLVVDRGYSLLKVINFYAYEKQIVFPEGLDYVVPEEGGQVVVPFQTNFDYAVDIPADATEWVSRAPQTKAEMHEERVTFDVRPNITSAERQAAIRIFAADVEQLPAEMVTITQRGVVAQGDFKIVVDRVGETFVNAYIVPQNKDMKYLSLTVKSEHYAQFPDEESLFNDDMQYFKNMADRYGMPIETLIEESAKKGDGRVSTNNLTPDTDYTVYVYGLDVAAQTKLTPVFKAEFHTQPVIQKDVRFTIQTEVVGAMIDAKFSADNYDGYYFVDVLKGYDETATDEKIKEDIKAQWMNLLSMYVKYGKTHEEILNELCKKGDFSRQYYGDPQSLYVPCAFAVDSEGMMCSEVQLQRVKTQDVLPSDNQISIKVSDIKAHSAFISVKTTNNDPYTFTLLSSASCGDLSDEEIFRILEQGASYTQNGDMNQEQTGLQAMTEYRIFIFGYQSGTVTTDMVQTRFTTGEEVVADIAIDLNYSSYYDSQELAKIDAGYALEARRNCVYVPFVYSTVPADQTVYIGVCDVAALGDPWVTDEYLMEEMLYNGSATVNPVIYQLPYDVTIIGMAFAMDADGNYSKLLYGPSMALTREGVSDPKECVEKYPWPYSTAQPKAVSQSNLMREFLPHPAMHNKAQLLQRAEIRTEDQVIRSPREVAAARAMESVKHVLK